MCLSRINVAAVRYARPTENYRVPGVDLFTGREDGRQVNSFDNINI